MNPKDQQEHTRRFRERQSLFISALQVLTCATSHWQIYLDSQDYTDDGEVSSRAVTNGDPSTDLDEFHLYINFITGQGFHLEVVVDADRNLHAVSWEEFKPDWPGELESVFSLRWHPVTRSL